MKHLWLILILILLAVHSRGADLCWDANPEPDVCGYEVLAWEQGKPETVEVMPVAVNRLALDALEDGRRYELAVVAVNSSGLRSVPSESVSYQAGASAGDRGRVVLTIESAPTPAFVDARVEAVIYQEMTSERRFYRAKIETP